jgi:hypothetical protein
VRFVHHHTLAQQRGLQVRIASAGRKLGMCITETAAISSMRGLRLELFLSPDGKSKLGHSWCRDVMTPANAMESRTAA